MNKHKKLGSPPFKASLTSVLLILAVERSHAYDIEGGTTVTVPDTQSSPWSIGDILRVGDVGNGTLTIQDTGAVSATSVLLGNGSSTGTLNVNGNIGSRGVIETAYIAKGSGTASLNLNGGILRATQNEGDFLRSFAAGTVTLLSEGGHVDNNGYNITIQSVLGGAGALTKAGAGTLTLTGTNTYSGGTMISGGTLQLGSGGTTGVIVGDVVNNGTLSFNRSNALTYAGVISGTGALSKAGAGALTLSSASTYTGTTTITAGSIIAGAVNVLSSSSAFILNGGALNLSNRSQTIGSLAGSSGVTLGTAALTTGGDNSSTIYSGIIAGTGGSLTKAGTGTMILTGTNSYTGGTTISGGTLKVGNGGTTGVIAGNVINNGILAFNRSNALTYAGVVSGTGGLVKEGAGALTLTGANTYSGGTTINGGALLIGSGGTTGTIVGDVVNNGTLGFNRSNTYAYAGVISGSGNVTKAGAGALTLTGASSYSGTTTVTAGSIVAGGANVLSSASAYTFSGGTLNLANFAQTIGSLAGTSNVALGTAALTSGGNHSSTTYSGIISGTGGSLVKTGTGTLILTGTNTYTGGTTISGGALQIGNGGTIGVIAGNVINNGTIDFNRSNALSYAGIISGTGALTKNGAGTLTLTGANTYSGGTTINAGTLQIGSNGTIGSIVGNVINNGILNFNRSNNLSYADAISGTGMLTKTGAGVLTLTGINTYTGGTTISAGTLQIGSNGTTGSIVGNVTNNAILNFNRSDDIGFTGTVIGTGALTKTGAGALTLSGANTYSGATTVTTGSIVAGGTNVLSSVSALTLGASTVLNLSDFAQIMGSLAGTGNVSLGSAALTAGGNNGTTSYGGIISGTGSLTKTGTGTMTLTGANTYSGGTTISGGTLLVGSGGATGSIVGNVSNNGTLGFSRNNAYTYAGVISGTGNLSKAGTGALTLSAASSYTGTTTVTAGSIVAGAVNVLSSSSAFALNGGALNLSNRSQTIASLAGSGGVTLGTAALTTGGNNSSTTYSGIISGTGSLVKTGTGTMILAGANTYTGGTTISGGTLQMGNGGTTGVIAGNVINNGTLSFNRSNAITYAGIVSGSGTLIQQGAGTTILTGASTYNGGTTISSGTLQIGSGATTGSIVGDVVNNGTISFNRSNAYTYAGAISGTGALSKAGAGALTLSGTSIYSGATTVTAGAITAGGANVLSSASAFTLNAGTTLNLANFTQSIGSLAGAGNVSLGTAALTAGGDNGSTSYSGAISGTGSLTKTGTGTMILTGTNTYTGGTTISAGTLQVGNGGTSGAITGNVSNNGTLAFNRSDDLSFNGIISGSGAFIKDGAGALTLNGTNTYTGATTITAGSLKAGSNDFLGNSSAVTIAAGATLDFNGYASTVSNIVGAGNISNSGGNTTLTLDSGSLGGDISGSFTLVKNGSGTRILSGANTHTGGTTINDGTLQIGAGGTSGSIMGDISNNGTLAFTRSDASSFNGVISGSGNLVKDGAGTLTLSGANTYTGVTAITAGTLQAGVNSFLASSSSVTVAAGASLELNGNTGVIADLQGAGNIGNVGSVAALTVQAGSFNGAMAGNISLVKDGTGTLTLTGSNNYAGGTAINAGVLQVGNGGTTGAIAGNVANNGALTFNRSDDSSFTGVISGAGNLVKDGTGTLTLAGTNTYTGATTITAGTLKGGSNDFLGNSSAVTIAAGAILDFNGYASTITNIQGAGSIGNSGATTILTLEGGDLTGGISGNFSLVKNSSDTLVLNGTNTHTGGTTINAGTLKVGSGGTSGSIIGDISNSGTLAFNRSDDLNFSGVISGAGELIKDGAGTLTLSGANTYTGVTTVSAGTLRAAAINAFSGNSAVTLAAGTHLDLDGFAQTVGSIAGNGNVSLGSATLSTGGDDSSTSYGGAISGNGGVSKIGAGALTLTGANIYTGATTVSGGSIVTGGINVLSSASAFALNGGTLNLAGFNQTIGSLAGSSNVSLGTATLTTGGDNSDTSYGGIVSGSGSLNKQGTGTMILTGSNIHTGGTTINDGTLQVGDGGTTGSLVGNVVNNATLSFNRSDDASFNGVISGSGALIKQGAGSLVLTGENLYTGDTVISAGTLKIGSGGTSGSVVGDINNQGTLVFNRGDAYTYSGVISGSGALVKTGAGNLILAGTNTHTGPTTVDAGTLSVNGSLLSGTTVNDGATLGGAGSVGNVTVLAGGSLAPGNSIGTLTVNGNLTFTSGSIYRVEVTAAGASDKTVVNGNVNLNGTVDVRAASGNYAANTTYGILSYSGTRTGTFAGTTSDLAFLTPSLSYLVNAVELTLMRNNVDFDTVAETPNQRNVANAVEALGSGSLYDSVAGLSAPQARTAFDTMSGTQHAAASQIAGTLGRSFSSALMSRASVASSAHPASAAFAGLKYASLDIAGTALSWQSLLSSPYQVGRGNLAENALSRLNVDGKAQRATAGIWGQILGATGEVKGDGNGTGSDYSASGFIGGYDAMISKDWLMGVSVGYVKTQWDASTPATGGIDTPFAAMYGRYESGPWQVRLNGSFADYRFNTNRTVTIGTASSTARSRHSGKEWSAAAEAEYAVGNYAGWDVRPLAGIRYAYLDESGFNETGSTAALNVQARSTQQANLGIGSRFLRGFDGDKGAVEFRAMVTHLAGDNDSPVTASFIGSNSTFNADGTPLRRTALVLGTGLSHRLSNRIAAYADLGYETRGNGQSNSVAAVGLQYRW